MKNMWIQHLEKQRFRDDTQDSSFVEMLHSLAKLDESEERTAKTKPFTEENRQYNLESIQEGLTFDDPDSKDIESLKKTALSDFKTKDSTMEICKWTAKSQRGYELGIDSCEDDYVQLLQLYDGQLVLRYNVAGEETFEMEVASTEEADSLIIEDNLTTSELYPDNAELQWSKK